MPDLNIKAQDDVLRGQYANMMQVSHSKEEFVLDFMLAFPPQGELVSRLIVSPAHMKRIAHALADNIKKYENQHGAIEEAGEPKLLS
ncbi:MAG: DUF3467 domain-containing protein [Patescibacteria group bacterium]|nr:DUF3467 domain-containing protein [Patescibacteria group bacterium]MBU2508822.1 DUF3467 domain-containing protein [Patescibacteria group bacterium]